MARKAFRLPAISGWNKAIVWKHFTRASIVAGFLAAVVGIVTPFLPSPSEQSYAEANKSSGVSPAPEAKANSANALNAERGIQPSASSDETVLPGLRTYFSLGHPNRTSIELIPFLENHIGDLVYLDLGIDLSVVGDTQNVWKRCHGGPGPDLFNNDLPIPVAYDDAFFERVGGFGWFDAEPSDYDCLTSIRIKTDRSEPELSYAGPGILSSRFTGFYRVRLLGRGATKVFLLEEQEADLPMKAKYDELYSNTNG